MTSEERQRKVRWLMRYHIAEKRIKRLEAEKERWRDRATRTTIAPTYFKYIDKQEDKNKMTKEQRRRNEMPPVIIRGGKHRIRAAELLGKRYGLYRDRIEIEFEGELKINVDYEEDAQ